MHGAITQKDAFLGAKLKLMRIIWPHMGPTGAAKGAERGIVRFPMEQALKGCNVVNGFARNSIDEIGSGQEGFNPEFEWHGSVREESKAYFNCVMMLPFSGSVLLVCIGARNMMHNPNFSKKGIKFLIFSSPIRLNREDFFD